MPIFEKSRRAREPTVFVGQVSQTAPSGAHVSPYKAKTVDLLRRLRQTTGAREAVKLLAREHPDVSMAVSSYISLANQGHEMAFYAADGSGRRLPELEGEWRGFAGRVGAMCGDGLDGLMNQLHRSYHLMGGIAFEVVVEEDGREVEDVYPIDPGTLSWDLAERGGKQVFIPYQQQWGKRADLSRANFFWAPCDPDIGSVGGNLALQAAIQAADHQMELYHTLDTALYRVGTPRYDITIDSERAAKSANNAIVKDPVKFREYMRGIVADAGAQLSHVGPKNDFVHSDDYQMNVIGGGANMSGIDARAFKEIADTEMLNALGMLGVLMNRYDSKTNALSSTEFQIMVDKMERPRRASKRAAEYIARIWLRCHGIAAVPVFTHNPIEWESLIDKYSAKLKEQEYYRRAEEYDWIGADTAAGAVMGVAGALEQPEGAARRFEYIKKQFQPDGRENSGDGGSPPDRKGEDEQDA